MSERGDSSGGSSQTQPDNESSSSPSVPVPSFFGPGFTATRNQLAQSSRQPYRPVNPQHSAPRPIIREKTVLDEVESITAGYEKEEITKPEAVRKLVALSHQFGASQSAKDEALVDFLGTLDEIETRVAELRARGRQTEETTGGGDGDETELARADRHDVDARERPNANRDDPEHDHGNVWGFAHKRKRDNQSDDESSDDESVEGGRKFDPKRLPWYGADEITKAARDPRCAKSAELLAFYLKYPKRVKQEAACSPSYPPGFPASELDKLVRGEPADFNAILSAHHHLNAPKENKGSFGNRTIVLGVSDPVRKVDNSGHWLIAASTYQKAISMLFPHRSKEFSTHVEYILGLFTSKNDSAHSRVIAFDLAIRSRVGGGTRLLLTDWSSFTDLKHAILDVDG
ncbi:hypothetical protein C0991_004836, partial [Blastosporella zonata]